MPFTSLTEISAAIPERFPFDSYSRYVLTQSEVITVEKELGQKIPRDVKAILTSFDLSSLEFGQLSFGVAGRATYLQKMNAQEYSPYPWWGVRGARPAGVLAVAMDEEGVVILDCSDSKILYFEGSTGELFQISENLETFVLACANFLWDSPENARVATPPSMGARFWRMYGVTIEG